MIPRLSCLVYGMALALPLSIGCRPSPDNLFEKRRIAEKNRETAMASAEDQAAASFNAVIGWQRIPAASTANVKAALMRADQRPVFFSGRLRDLDTAGDGYTVTIDVDAWLPDALRFRLNCDRDVAKVLLDKQIGVGVAGVAAIIDVRMTRDGGLGGIDRRFSATGRCLSIRSFN